MKKLNNKGYMLVEIIMAFAITFGLIYFLMDLVINLKNKNDDLLVDTVIKTDQTIISNKLMDYIIDDTNDENDIKFSCDKIIVDGNVVKYGEDIIGIVDESATISYNLSEDKGQCSNKNGRIHINIPVEVKQMPDKNYDIVVDYRYKLMYCNPNQSYNCKDVNGNWINDDTKNYAFIYTGQCEVKDDGNGDWRIKFLTDGDFSSTCDMQIDAFLVGGGGGGGRGTAGKGGGGGGGGYTTTGVINVVPGKKYTIDIGDGGESRVNGETTYAFNLSAVGGENGDGSYGENAGSGLGGVGGSGGGSSNSSGGGAGGSNGSAGMTRDGGYVLGTGISTCEFNEDGCSDDRLYSGGGGAGGRGGGTGGLGGAGGGGNGSSGTGKDGKANTGGGGGGGGNGSSGDGRSHGGSGGSGIVVIRNSKENVYFDFEYTNETKTENRKFLYIDDGNGNWRIKFLESGYFTPKEDIVVDAFLLGGGGGGERIPSGYSGGGGGGGSGYVSRRYKFTLEEGKQYYIEIGAGGTQEINGGNTVAFDRIAKGGENGTSGKGGSGGGGNSGKGGSNGGDGSRLGAGAGVSTYEFGNSNLSLYAFGGDGGQDGYGCGASAISNTGSGGGGSGGRSCGGQGGSGIVVIRNARESNNEIIDFEYTGYYKYIDDGNGDWRLKFLTNGDLKIYENISIDVFLVGGGGGGFRVYKECPSKNGGGGGGGYTKTEDYDIISDVLYKIVIGAGGFSRQSGGDTSAFGYIVKGGNSGNNLVDCIHNGGDGGQGGSAGSGGVDGKSQDGNTCEFGIAGCSEDLIYSKGGGAGTEKEGTANTGSGGGGSNGRGYPGDGGTGIVVIRNKRE